MCYVRPVFRYYARHTQQNPRSARCTRELSDRAIVQIVGNSGELKKEKKNYIAANPGNKLLKISRGRSPPAKGSV